MSKVFSIEKDGLWLDLHVLADDAAGAVTMARLFGVLGDGNYTATEAAPEKAAEAINAEHPDA